MKGNCAQNFRSARIPRLPFVWYRRRVLEKLVSGCVGGAMRRNWKSGRLRGRSQPPKRKADSKHADY
jgi:hypothetical protein